MLADIGVGTAAALNRRSKKNKPSSDYLQSSQDALATRLAGILSSDAPTSDKLSIAADATKEGPAENPLLKLLGVLDVPRAAIVATGTELGNLGRNVFRGENNDLSPQAWSDMVGSHRGVGDVVEDAAPDLPLNVKRVAGFIGDVAADPLSYIAPEAKLADLGSHGVARIAFKAAEGAASDAERKALEVIGQKAAKGVSTLTNDELRIVSEHGITQGVLEKPLQGGVYFNKPGTGRIGQKVAQVFGHDMEVQQARIAGRGAATSGVASKLRAGEEALRTSRVGEAASSLFTRADKKALIDMMRRGDPSVARKAFFALEGEQAARLQAGKYLGHVEAQRQQLLRQVDKSGIQGDWVTHALDGNAEYVNMIEQKAPGLFEKIRQFDEGVRSLANKTAGEDFIPFRAFHSPGLRSDELKTLIGEKGVGRAASKFGAAGFEQKAKIVAGGEFMGETLLPATKDQAKAVFEATGNHLPVHPEGLSPKEQAQQVFDKFRESIGEDAVHLFNSDWRDASRAQVHAVAKRLEGKILDTKLREHGVAEDLYRPAATKDSLKAVAAKTKLEDKLASLVPQKRAAEQALQSASDLHENAAVAGLRQVVEGEQAVGAARSAASAAKAAAEQPSPDVARALQEAVAAHQNREAAVARQKSLETIVGAVEKQHAAPIAASEAQLSAAHNSTIQATSRLSDLQALKAEADAKVARAKSVAGDRIGQAEHVVELQKQADALGQQIANMSKGRARNVRQQATRLPSEVRADIAAVDAELGPAKVRLQRLQEISANLAAGDHASRVDAADWLRRLGMTPNGLQGEIKNLRNWVARGDKLKNNLSLSLKRSESAYGSETAKINEAKGQLHDLAQQAQALGNDREAMQIAQLRDTLPSVNERGQLVSGHRGDGSPVTGWFHGSGQTLNMAPTKNMRGEYTGAFDTRFGVHFTSDPNAAAAYVSGTKPSIAEVSLNMKNPKVMLPDDARWADRLVGTPITGVFNRRIELHVNALEQAWHDGVVSPEILAKGDRQILDLWNQVDVGMQHGLPMADAIDSVFGGAFERGDVFPFNHIGAPQDTVGAVMDSIMWTPPLGEEDVVTRMGNGALDNELLNTIADGYVAGLKAQGHDGIVYQLSTPGSTREDDVLQSFAAIAFDPEQVKLEKGSNAVGQDMKGSRTIEAQGPNGPISVRKVGNQQAAHDLYAHEKVLVRNMYRKAAEKQKIASKVFGYEIDKQTDKVAVAHVQELQNLKRVDELHHQLADVVAPLNERMAAAARDELAARMRVSQMRAEADRIAEVSSTAAQARVAETQDQLAALQAHVASDNHEAAARALRLQAAAEQASLDVAKVEKKVVTVEQALAQLGSPEVQYRMRYALRAGMKPLGLNTQASAEIVDALKAGDKLFSGEDLNIFVRSLDKVTNLFRAYAIMSPGFQIRNYIGGMFNNYLAGIHPGAYRRWISADAVYTEAIKKGLTPEQALAKIPNKAVRESYRTVIDNAVLGTAGQSGEVSSVIASGAAKGGALDAMHGGVGVLSNPLTRLNAYEMGRVERTLRGALAMDVVHRGGTADDAINAVFKYHFDYEDLSNFEKNVMRRVFPFYTWTRKNLPLQIESIITNPKAFVRYYQLKNETEMGNPNEKIVPSWFGDQMAIHTDMNFGGGDTYVMPDLPFKDLSNVGEPNQLMGMLNPIIKTPIELRAGKQLYSDVPFKPGLTAVPEAWNKLGVGGALEATGVAKRGKDGTLMAPESALYFVEQYMPLLGRARRAFPSEQKYNDRLATSLVSMLFGVGSRTNTVADQAGELRRRTKQVDEVAQELDSRGYGGYYQYTKPVFQETADPAPKARTIPALATTR